MGIQGHYKMQMTCLHPLILVHGRRPAGPSDHPLSRDTHRRPSSIVIRLSTHSSKSPLHILTYYIGRSKRSVSHGVARPHSASTSLPGDLSRAIISPDSLPQSPMLFPLSGTIARARERTLSGLGSRSATSMFSPSFGAVLVLCAYTYLSTRST